MCILDVYCWLQLYILPVYPDTASDEPATEKEGDQALHGVGRLWILRKQVGMIFSLYILQTPLDQHIRWN